MRGGERGCRAAIQEVSAVPGERRWRLQRGVERMGRYQGLAETEPAGPGEEGGRRGGAGEGSRVPGLAMTTTEQ